MRHFFLALVSSLALTQCTPDIHEQTINVTDPVDETKVKAVSTNDTVATFASTFEGKPLKLEYLSCQSSAAKAWVLAVNNDFAAFKKGDCQSAPIQAFLSKGFNVAAVNRPGYGGSLPKIQDFSGRASQQGLAELAKKLGQVDGLWGTGAGSIAAGFAAKHISNLKWVMLGNTISDLEQYNAAGASKRYKPLIKEAMSGSDANAFYEQRSLAWDVAGFARHVLLYHSKTDADVPVDQSRALRDRLAAEEYQVKLEEIDGVDHEIPDAKHRVIIVTILDKFAEAAASK